MQNCKKEKMELGEKEGEKKNLVVYLSCVGCDLYQCKFMRFYVHLLCFILLCKVGHVLSQIQIQLPTTRQENIKILHTMDNAQWMVNHLNSSYQPLAQES